MSLFYNTGKFSCLSFAIKILFMINQLGKILKDHKEDVNEMIKSAPDWNIPFNKMEALYARMKNPADKVWGKEGFQTFSEVYYAQRDKDKGMSNIVARTIPAMPEQLKNNAKIMFLQIAEICCFFNASHKVNFEVSELPEGYDEIRMTAKGKGVFTYAFPIPSLYKKISLTFDYWVPKFLDWCHEIRDKGLKDWKGEAILEHESCTDFMRICLLFLSDTKHNPPIAKAEDRETFLKMFGEEFVWVKKSAKREDILTNSEKLREGLARLNKEVGIDIPLESWSRISQASFIKGMMK
jgi:hypothetical protein